MLEPELVREIVHQMQRRTSLPITVKCRIGVDDLDSYEALTRFISTVHTGGVKKFVIHARKCLLQGLTTRQNRDIPPLHYEVVHQLVQDFPDLQFVLNGGVTTFDQASTHLQSPWIHNSPSKSDNNQVEDDSQVSQVSPDKKSTSGRRYDIPSSSSSNSSNDATEYPAVHGVMIGRAAYHNPMLFATADSTFFNTRDPCLTRRQILEKYLDYCDWIQSDAGPQRTVKGGRHQMISTSVLINSMRNVICGIPHVQKFRVALNDLYMDQLRIQKDNPNPNPRLIIEEAMKVLNEDDLDAPLGNVDFYPVDV